MGTLVGQASNAEGYSLTRRDGTDYFNTITLATTQPLPLPLLLDHDPGLPAGEVVYIEEHPRSGVIVVANVTRPLNGRQHLSLGAGRDQITSIDVINPLAVQRRADSAVLREISVVDRPGAAVFPVSYSERDLDPYDAGGWPTSWPSLHKSVAIRAAEYLRRNRHARALEVQYHDPELERLADDHLADEVRRQRRDEKLIAAHEGTAEYLTRKYARQVASQPDLVSFDKSGNQVHRRRNIGHIVSVR